MTYVSSAARTRTEGLAQRLLEAERTATPVEPLSAEHPDLGIDEAYAVQLSGRTVRIAAGERIVGHKIGLTSRAMQEMVGVAEPDYGYLTDAMVLADGASVQARGLIAPRVEGEIAFRLGTALAGSGVTAREVLEATESVAAALELIDSRIADWRITIVDTIADNASSARAVVGPWTALAELDLAALTMRMRVDDQEVEGRGEAVLGHPAEAVAWLARALHAQGETLEAGELILSGALARALPVSPGSRATATIDGLGTVGVSFSA